MVKCDCDIKQSHHGIITCVKTIKLKNMVVIDELLFPSLLCISKMINFVTDVLFFICIFSMLIQENEAPPLTREVD